MTVLGPIVINGHILKSTEKKCSNETDITLDVLLIMGLNQSLLESMSFNKLQEALEQTSFY